MCWELVIVVHVVNNNKYKNSEANELGSGS